MHEGNSRIFIDSDGLVVPLIIDTIVRHPTDPAMVFFLVKRVKPVDTDDDPYPVFPIFGAKIWSHGDDLEADLEIVLPSDVVGHFASCDMQVKGTTGEMIDAAVVVPLRKVRHIIVFELH
jgi:hypothetical protein